MNRLDLNAVGDGCKDGCDLLLSRPSARDPTAWHGSMQRYISSNYLDSNEVACAILYEHKVDLMLTTWFQSPTSAWKGQPMSHPEKPTSEKTAVCCMYTNREIAYSTQPAPSGTAVSPAHLGENAVTHLPRGKYKCVLITHSSGTACGEMWQCASYGLQNVDHLFCSNTNVLDTLHINEWPQADW